MGPTDGSRALHWVLKIGNLKKSLYFFEKVLGLKVLRHEEFESGCEATCNGPYGGAWSKTMIGYGPEDSNFALELTYNYGVEGYQFGNDLLYIALSSPTAIRNAELAGFAVKDDIIHGPDNYKFKIIPQISSRVEAFAVVGLRVANLANAKDYWVNLLGMKEVPTPAGLETRDSSVTVSFGPEQTMLQLVEVHDGQAVDHALSSGRIAFACKSVPPIFEAVSKAGDKVQTPPLTLPTPGKADVVVTILVDRDGYEICFVEDKAFYELATPTYDVVDYEIRRARGGDGAPPPKAEKLIHSSSSESPLVEVETVDDLRAVITKASSEGKFVVLDFGASWCKNCKRILPFIEKQAARYFGQAVFVSVDIAASDEIALEYNVSSVPRFFVYNNKEEKIDDYLGSSETDLKNLLAKHLSAGGSSDDQKRALHWVLKIGNLKKSMHFFENVLGLKVLRHEEFDSGCEATCNGPYGGAWSKTMIGYGPEDSNFALELTYNYGVEGYQFGNDLQYIALSSSTAVASAQNHGYQVLSDGATIQGPDNYKYKIIPQIPDRVETFAVVGLRVANLATAKDYWVNLLGMKEVPTPAGLETRDPSVTVSFGPEQTMLQLVEVHDGQAVDHALSSGRIAFACKSVPPIFDAVSKAGDKVQTPPLTLPTPGKADVVVTILVDRDGYEICFVEDEAFYDLATPLYDVIDFVSRASRGGDGAPPPKAKAIEHSTGGIVEVEDSSDLPGILEAAKEAGKTVLLDFNAGWCKNCKKIAPLLETLSVRHGTGITVVSIDIDALTEVAVEYGVSTLPRLLAFKGEEKVGDYLGSDESEIRALFSKLAPVVAAAVTTTAARSSAAAAAGGVDKRALHWVLKIGNLKTSMAFFENVLGLRVLRHEEFDSGCEATCNGPYGGAWSKTMIGYGPEDSNFALELTYNYGVEGYQFGNDLQYIALANPSALVRAAALGYNTEGNVIQGPDKYKYKIVPRVSGRSESFLVVGLRVANLATAKDYWVNLLGMKEVPTPAGLETRDPSVTVSFGPEQTMLQLIEVHDGQAVDHALSSGRIAFACKCVEPIFQKVTVNGDKVQTPPLRLPTPGKADVVVTILVDRDGYEICFVEDEAFYDLATPLYDVIDFVSRASRGGDGAPPPNYKTRK